MLDWMTKPHRWGHAALFGAFALGLALSAVPAAADSDEEMETKLNQILQKLESDERRHDVQAVYKMVVDANIPIDYEYIANVMRENDAFGEDSPACILCHNKNKTYGGLDLSSCEGIKKGGTSGAFIIAGKPKDGSMRRRLRDNRMPLGITPLYPSDTPNHKIVYDWIKGGLKNDANFKNNVLPLFAKEGAFGPGPACTECHLSNQEPPSFHELDMTSWTGIVEKGADSVAKAAEGLPPVLIVIKGKPEESKLWLRLTENRMPLGIDSGSDRDHYNLGILMNWVQQGAKCN